MGPDWLSPTNQIPAHFPVLNHETCRATLINLAGSFYHHHVLFIIPQRHLLEVASDFMFSTVKCLVFWELGVGVCLPAGVEEAGVNLVAEVKG